MLKHPFFVATLMLAWWITGPAQAGAEGPITPSWLTWDAERKQAEMTVKAAYNGNNGTWNYNGYYEGGITIVVPLGAKVVIHFVNPDGNYPHSLLVTRPYGKDELPDRAGRAEVALSRAYTKSPDQGCISCKEDFRFKAKTAGQYYFYCGVPGHGQAGMWIRFEVSEGATDAHALLAEGVPDPGDQQPWQ